MRSASVSRSPFCRGLVAGSTHGTTAGQPSLIVCGASNGWTGAQAASNVRQVSSRPVAQLLVFMDELLDLLLSVGQLLADPALLFAQLLLGVALGSQDGIQLVDDCLPPGAVLLGPVGAIDSAIGGGLGQLDALMLDI